MKTYEARAVVECICAGLSKRPDICESAIDRDISGLSQQRANTQDR